MNALDIMKRPAAYVSGYENTPTEEQNRAKQLCWEYNRTAPNEQEKRRSILQALLGTCSPMTGIEPDFHCDYGFNIHLLDILDAWSAYNRTCRFANHQFSLCQFLFQQSISSRFTELVHKKERISAGKIYHIRIFKNRLYR